MIWIPTHISVTDHDIADSLANQAKTTDVIAYFTHCLDECNSLVEFYIWKKWMQKWNEQKSINYQQNFLSQQLLEQHGIKFTNTSRKK